MYKPLLTNLFYLLSDINFGFVMEEMVGLSHILGKGLLEM